MPIVPNIARETDAIDKPYNTWNRKNAGAPSGTLTPLYLGELVLDTTNATMWQGVGLATTDWKAISPRV